MTVIPCLYCGKPSVEHWTDLGERRVQVDIQPCGHGGVIDTDRPRSEWREALANGVSR